MNRAEARKASRNGAIAAFVSAGITTIVVVIAMGTNAQDALLGTWNDPAIVVDIAIVLVCGIALLRCSRAAAVLLLLYWVVSKIYIVAATGQAGGLLPAFIFGYFFARAAQGSFVYHRIRRSADPEYRVGSKWAYILGIPSLVLLLCAIGYGLLTMTDVLPSTKVLAGAEVSASDRQLLIDNGVLDDEERIEYFYSYGLSSILEGGSLLTDFGVTIYLANEENEIETYWMPFEDIASVELEEAGDWLNDAVYRVNGRDEGAWMMLQLSTEEEGDTEFIEALQQHLDAIGIQDGLVPDQPLLPEAVRT